VILTFLIILLVLTLVSAAGFASLFFGSLKERDHGLAITSGIFMLVAVTTASFIVASFS
jgi:hypothetical protein